MFVRRRRRPSKVRRDRSVREYNKRPNVCVYRVSRRVPTVPVIVSTCRETRKMYVRT